MAPLSKETISRSDESDTDSSAVSQSSKLKKQTKNATKSSSPSSSSPSSSSSAEESQSSDSSDDSDSDSSRSNRSSGKKPAAQPKTTASTSTRNIQHGPVIPAQPFKPPENFKKITNGVPRNTEASNILSNLKGKQLWHITAPASVPVSSIRTLALDAVATGEPVLSHKGSQYRLREEQISADRNKSLLIPDAMGNTYHESPQSIVQTFHVEEVIELPDANTPAQQIEKYVKPVRQQPKNLRARHTPIGSTRTPELPQQSLPGNKSQEGIDATDENNGSEREQKDKSKKRKHTEKHSPRKKSKSEVDSPHRGKKDDEKEEEKGKNKSHKSKHRDETNEERKARHEEKKRKKEAKAAK